MADKEKTLVFDITFETNDGPVPSQAELVHIVGSQMSGELDPETGLHVSVVKLSATEETQQSAEEDDVNTPGDEQPTYERLQHGIFNLVVSLHREVQGYANPALASEYVSQYLKSLIDGLEPETEEND